MQTSVMVTSQRVARSASSARHSSCPLERSGFGLGLGLGLADPNPNPNANLYPNPS